MRISDWSSDVCSSDLLYLPAVLVLLAPTLGHAASCSDNVDVNATVLANGFAADLANTRQFSSQIDAANVATLQLAWADVADGITERRGAPAGTQQARSEEHTSELQSLMRISYAVFCLKNKKQYKQI